MRRGLVAVAVVAVLAAAGCAAPATDEVTATALDDAGVAVGSSWQLVSGRVDGEDLRLLPDRPITFTRTADGFEGQSSCNTYAELEAMSEPPDGRVLPDFEGTAMGCPLPGEESLDNPIMDLEDAFLDALYATTDVEVGGDALRLTGPDSTLVFERRDPGGVGAPVDDDATTATGPTPQATSPTAASATDPVATAGTWVLESGVVDGVTLDPVSGGRVDMTAAAGQLGGRAACNEYGGTYTVEGDRLDAQVTAVTDMGCPGARMDTEAAFLDALGRVTTVQRTEARLTLSGDGVKLGFIEEAPLVGDALVGVRWHLEAVARGTTTTPAGGDGFLLLDEDGTWTGSTGCRAMSGEWQGNGSSVVFPSWGADGDCGADLQDQDRAVTQVLENPLVSLDGDRLTLAAPDGGEDATDLPALVYRATPVGDVTTTGTDPDPSSGPDASSGSDPSTDPSRRSDSSPAGDAAFAGTVFLWRTGGIAGLDESVTIFGDGRISVTSADVGIDHQLGRSRLASLAAALQAFDWDALAGRIDPTATTDDVITWHVERFGRALVISDADLPHPPPALLVEAAALLDEFAPDA